LEKRGAIRKKKGKNEGQRGKFQLIKKNRKAPIFNPRSHRAKTKAYRGKGHLTPASVLKRKKRAPHILSRISFSGPGAAAGLRTAEHKRSTKRIFEGKPVERLRD